jgi:hypothetical protein
MIGPAGDSINSLKRKKMHLDQILTKPIEEPKKSRTRLYAPINGFSLDKGYLRGLYGEGEKVAA